MAAIKKENYAPNVLWPTIRNVLGMTPADRADYEMVITPSVLWPRICYVLDMTPADCADYDLIIGLSP